METLSIYFHKDFDGLASAALLSKILEKSGTYLSYDYFPIDFDVRDEWLSHSLRRPAAVLDFFYHPEVSYFFDHHATSFIDHIHKVNYVETDTIILDTSFKSTPSILKYKFSTVFNFEPFKELIRWSDIIDNICIYDQSDTALPLQRFLPYYYYPSVDYTISLYKKYHDFSVVISYNPWKKENNPFHLGEMAKEYGGYGRENAGGILCKTHEEATVKMESIFKELIRR
ncbi:hypothetical protein [Bacillus horti]|nr:hypothetical protein [Bacillus horti]